MQRDELDAGNYRQEACATKAKVSTGVLRTFEHARLLLMTAECIHSAPAIGAAFMPVKASTRDVESRKWQWVEVDEEG